MYIEMGAYVHYVLIEITTLCRDGGVCTCTLCKKTTNRDEMGAYVHYVRLTNRDGGVCTLCKTY